MVCQWKSFSSSEVLYIFRKVIKCGLYWYHFFKRGLKLLPSKTSNTVYVNENFFDNDDILYTVEKVLKHAT